MEKSFKYVYQIDCQISDKIRITDYTILKIFVVFFNNLERVIRDRAQIKLNTDNDGITEKLLCNFDKKMMNQVDKI